MVDWIAADDAEGLLAEGTLAGLDGIVVPGGFGVRGIEGKIAAAAFAREHDIPYLGLCLGLQCAVIEFARDVCGLVGANSAEFDTQTPHPVIDLMDEQKSVVDMGGTMRLGAYPARLEAGTQIREIYGEEVVYERHRHRYELNNRYRQAFEERGLRCSGTSPDGLLVEYVELHRPPVLRRDAGAPGVQEPPEPSAPAVRGVRGSRAPAGRGPVAAPADRHGQRPPPRIAVRDACRRSTSC